MLARRRPGAEAEARKAAPARKKTRQAQTAAAIFCRGCGHLISDRRHRTERQGKHSHRFMNPAGFVFRIGCFAEAIGCVVVGPDNLDYPWFTGHAWRYAHCAGCGHLLGWHFRAPPDPAAPPFFGLILERLREGPGD